MDHGSVGEKQSHLCWYFCYFELFLLNINSTHINFFSGIQFKPLPITAKDIVD